MTSYTQKEELYKECLKLIHSQKIDLLLADNAITTVKELLHDLIFTHNIYLKVKTNTLVACCVYVLEDELSIQFLEDLSFSPEKSILKFLRSSKIISRRPKVLVFYYHKLIRLFQTKIVQNQSQCTDVRVQALQLEFDDFMNAMESLKQQQDNVSIERLKIKDHLFKKIKNSLQHCKRLLYQNQLLQLKIETLEKAIENNFEED